MNKTDRVHVFSDFLREEGYSPKIDGDGDITFKIEGHVYFVSLDDDEEFFRIIFPCFWKIESAEERSRVERAALKANADIKVAKVFPVKDNTWAVIEIFSSSIENTKSVFGKSVRALQAAVSTFLEEMRR